MSLIVTVVAMIKIEGNKIWHLCKTFSCEKTKNNTLLKIPRAKVEKNWFKRADMHMNKQTDWQKEQALPHKAPESNPSQKTKKKEKKWQRKYRESVSNR